MCVCVCVCVCCIFFKLTYIAYFIIINPYLRQSGLPCLGKAAVATREELARTTSAHNTVMFVYCHIVGIIHMKTSLLLFYLQLLRDLLPAWLETQLH